MRRRSSPNREINRIGIVAGIPADEKRRVKAGAGSFIGALEPITLGDVQRMQSKKDVLRSRCAVVA